VRDAASIGRWLQIDLADAVLCYEAHGEALVRAARPRKKVGHLNNSTDGFALRAEFDALAATPRSAIRKRLGIRPGASVMCGLGRLVAEKEFIRLVSILARVQRIRPDTQLVLIGDGPEMPKIDGRVEDAGLRDHVVFAGSVRGAPELAPWLVASDVSVSPAAIGLSVVDALFAGLPTITPAPGKAGPHHGPEYRYLEPGKTALITEENSDDALARACIELFEMPPGARDAMSQACTQFATANLGVARMAAAMNEFVSGVVHARNATPRNHRYA
jgi:glycosyltransferase involved in cell wall biosynthesis